MSSTRFPFGRLFHVVLRARRLSADDLYRHERARSAHYQFDYVRREFLGDVRCVVFDVTPLPKSGKGRFKGRFWAEDQNYTIVRFNGVYTPIAGINGFNLHFDSWRHECRPGLWLPAFVFSQESDLKDFLGNHVRFKSQTRLWGYDLKSREPSGRIQRADHRVAERGAGSGGRRRAGSLTDRSRARVAASGRSQRIGPPAAHRLAGASGRSRQGSRDGRQQPGSHQQSRHRAGSSLPRAADRDA